MIKLTFFRSQDEYVGLSCKGHAGYSEHGSDIVCAAVSTAVELCAAYLTTYHSDSVEFLADDSSAEMSLKCTRKFPEADKHINILVEFARSLTEQYPKYFTFDFLEV